MSINNKPNSLPTIHPCMLAALESGDRHPERCSHGKLWAEDCTECNAVWDSHYGTVSKDAYDGARQDLLLWKSRALEAEAKLSASQAQVQMLREALEGCAQILAETGGKIEPWLNAEIALATTASDTSAIKEIEVKGGN